MRNDLKDGRDYGRERWIPWSLWEAVEGGNVWPVGSGWGGSRLCHCCCHRWVTLVVEPSSAALYSSQQLQIQSGFQSFSSWQSVCGRAGRAGHPPCLVQLGFCWSGAPVGQGWHFFNMDCFGISCGRDLLKSRVNLVWNGLIFLLYNDDGGSGRNCWGWTAAVQCTIDRDKALAWCSCPCLCWMWMLCLVCSLLATLRN